jgi:hypothetical protein
MTNQWSWDVSDWILEQSNIWRPELFGSHFYNHFAGSIGWLKFVTRNCSIVQQEVTLCTKTTSYRPGVSTKQEM